MQKAKLFKAPRSLRWHMPPEAGNRWIANTARGDFHALFLEDKCTWGLVFVPRDRRPPVDLGRFRYRGDIWRHALMAISGEVAGVR